MGPSRISQHDLRSILHLAGHLIQMPRQRLAQVTYFLRWVGRLLDLPVLTLGECHGLTPETQGDFATWVIAASIVGDGDRPRLEDLMRPAGEQPLVPAVCRRSVPQLVCKRDELNPDRSWFGSPRFDEHMRSVGLETTMVMNHPLPHPKRSMLMGIMGPIGAPQATRRQRKVLEVVNAEIGWFFRSLAVDERDPRCRRLSPQLTRSLERLLAGDSEKQAAIRLRLSRFTLHQYVKELYKRYQVSSRGELLAKFVTPPYTDGSDTGYDDDTSLARRGTSHHFDWNKSGHTTVETVPGRNGGASR